MSVHNVAKEIERAALNNAVFDFSDIGIKTDVIAESTAATGVTIDGVLLKDNAIAAPGAIKSSDVAGGVGYSSGAGGTVTQLTSKSTGVVINKVCGEITMNNAALAADAIVSFTMTNLYAAAGDVLVLNHISGGTVGAYTLNAQCASESAIINVANRSAGSLSEAIVIQFAVIRAVNT